MTGLPSVFYFPYIDLEPATFKGLVCLFREVILLQPGFSVAACWTEEGERRGWVKSHRPLHVDLDTKQAQALLREYDSLGSLYQDSGYLEYLKHGGARRLEEESGYELIRDIRCYGRACPEPDDRETVRGQILLQMAQDLDRQRREIQEALGELQHQERSMQRNMGLGLEEAHALEIGIEPLPSLEEDDFLIPQRLQAWGEMLAAMQDCPPGPLLTDNRAAIETMVDWATVRSGDKATAFETLFQAPVPRFVPSDLGEVARIRQALSGLLPWKIFCERLEKLLLSAREAPWTAARRRDLLATGRALSAYLQDTVLEVVLASVAELEPSWREGWQEVSLTAVLFPNQTEFDLLRGQGEAPTAATGRNAIVLHLEDRQDSGVRWPQAGDVSEAVSD